MSRTTAQTSDRPDVAGQSESLTAGPATTGTATVLFPEARQRARRRRAMAISLIGLAVAITATAIILLIPGRTTTTSSPNAPSAVVPASTSCDGFVPKPVPSPNFLSALANEPDLLGSAEGTTPMTECEARMAAEQNIVLGEPVGDLTAATTSRLMTLAEANKLIPTGITTVLPNDRMVWVVTVHRQTASYTPPGGQSDFFPDYSVVYDAKSAVTIASELGSNALG